MLALAGITVGVALVFAALIANTSLTGSIRQLTNGIVGDAQLQLSARGQHGVDERLLADVKRIEGVEDAAPLLEVRANVVGPRGRRRSVVLIGGDASFSGLDGTMLSRFVEAELGRQKTVGLPLPIATQLGLSLGQPLTLEIGSRKVVVPLGAQLQRTDIGGLIDSPVALGSLPSVQRMSAMPGRITRIFVRAEAGRESVVENALLDIAGDRLNVGSSISEVDIFERAALPTNQSIALFSAFSALVGFLFAFSAVLLTVPQRRRLIADLRMAGHEPWVLVQVLMFDAIVLGAAGAGLGLLLGDQLSRHLFDTTPGYLSAAFAVGSQRIVTWQAAAIAGCAGLGAACLAVLVPLRDILSRYVRPVSAEPRGRDEVWLAALGCLCLVATTVVLIEVPAAAFLSILALTVALLCLLPLFLGAVAAAFGAAGRSVKSPVPVLAILELRSRATHLRTLAVAATGGVAVFATVAIGGAHADLERGLQQSAREIDGNADVWVTFSGRGNMLGTTYVAEPGRYVASLERLPEVRRVLPYRGSFLDVGDLRAWVLAPSAESPRAIPPSQIEDGEPVLAERRVTQGGWVALSEAIADELGVSVGDPVTLPSPVRTPLRVAAVTTNLAWPSGAIVLNAEDYSRAWDTRYVSGLQVEAAPSSTPPAVALAVERALGPDAPLEVETRDERIQRHYGTADDALSRLTQISILVIVSAMLAMAAAMGGMIWQRRETLAALKVHGYPEGELWRALLLESGLLLGTGCLIGGMFGLYGQILMSRALATITGFPVVYSAAGTTALTILILVTVVSVAMLAIPGWFAVRVRPAPGLTR